MFNPVVQLKSGGYIVIDVTEALVAIDVNSGRATREASIEDTALKTNLEAAEEAARQMRLRDLAGLIVIDFIDMEDRRNNAAVEKKLKDKLKTDRARIQVGRISPFGLLEMSRQRLRPGMIEATTKACPHCHGTGRVRSDDSLALALLREVEEEGVRQRSKEVLIVAPVEIANYLLNQKREHIAMIEARFGLSVRVEGDPSLISPDYRLERFKTASRIIPAPESPEPDRRSPIRRGGGRGGGAPRRRRRRAEAGPTPAAGSGSGGGKRKRRRRRRGGKGRGRRRHGGGRPRPTRTPPRRPSEAGGRGRAGAPRRRSRSRSRRSGAGAAAARRAAVARAAAEPAEPPEPRRRRGAAVAVRRADRPRRGPDAPEIVEVPEADAPQRAPARAGAQAGDRGARRGGQRDGRGAWRPTARAGADAEPAPAPEADAAPERADGKADDKADEGPKRRGWWSRALSGS